VHVDLIKEKLAVFALAIAPDSEGYVLFKRSVGSPRPAHVLLRIHPMSVELCSPTARSLFPSFSLEKFPVTSLDEAIMEFTKSSDWPVVRRIQFGVDWSKNHVNKPKIDIRVDHQWDADVAESRELVKAFLDDTVQNIHKTLSIQQEKYADSNNLPSDFFTQHYG